ncbi:MAG: TetR/AcrR family transcriptional regulator [Bacteroidia bacterium]|nr:TetR/AcrR family transcriptional regulator [Bacteroidia bacterium]
MGKTTEEKILEAAKTAFIRDGFNGARVRDIAESAGVNLALVNYHFGSKRELFNAVMGRALVTFRDSMLGMVHDETTDLKTKIRECVRNYSQMLEENPQLISFVMHGLSRDEGEFARQFAVQNVFLGSAMQKQLISEGLSEEQSEQFMVTMFTLLAGACLTAPITKIVLSKDDSQMKEFFRKREEALPSLLEIIIEFQKLEK